MTALGGKELSRRSGVPERTLREWANRGVLAPNRISRRSSRRYTDHDLTRAVFMRSLRETGVEFAQARRALRRFEQGIASAAQS